MIISCFSPNDQPHELWWYSLCRLQICYWRCVSEAWAKPNRNKCFHRYRAGGLRSSKNFCSIPDIVSLIFPLNIFLLSHGYILFSDVVGLLSPSDIYHSSRHGQSSPHRVGVIFVQFSWHPSPLAGSTSLVEGWWGGVWSVLKRKQELWLVGLGSGQVYLFLRNFTTFCIRSESGTGIVINSNFLAGCRFCRNCRRCKKQDWDREDFRRQVCQGFFLPFCGKIFHFFRDVLAAKGKGLDARQKLEKMRNLKVGN